jgi:raffinose/stachyose/melibiose transport system permease protein
MAFGLRQFWKKYAAGYLFILPTVVLYLLFIVYPFIQSFLFSLTSWDGISKVKPFVGLGNYVRFANDRVALLALQHNLIWMVAMAVIPIGFGLFLAMLLWRRPPGFNIFRTFYFMPQTLGAAVVGIIFKWIYQSRLGVLSMIAQATGLKFLNHPWLGDVNTALGSILIANIWSGVGFFFVIMLAGLQSVDRDLIDAAMVDGANAVARFRYIIVPQLSHVLTMVITLALIGGLNVFDIVWSMTGGGPANSSELIGTYTYTNAFVIWNVGYAASLTMIHTAFALLVTVVFIRLRERREA